MTTNHKFPLLVVLVPGEKEQTPLEGGGRGLRAGQKKVDKGGVEVALKRKLISSCQGQAFRQFSCPGF